MRVTGCAHNLASVVRPECVSIRASAYHSAVCLATLEHSFTRLGHFATAAARGPANRKMRAMAYAKTSERREKRLLREQMRSMGLSYRDIAAEFARRYKMRPRAAWREAYGWSLQDTADRINSFRGNTGLDPGAIAAMTAPHLSEYENWPGHRPEPSGRRPTPYLLAVLAAVYDCAVADLVDLSDREHLRPADLLILDKYSQPAAKPSHLRPEPAVSTNSRHDQDASERASSLTARELPDARSPGSGMPAARGRSAPRPWRRGVDRPGTKRRQACSGTVAIPVPSGGWCAPVSPTSACLCRCLTRAWTGLHGSRLAGRLIWPDLSRCKSTR